MSERIELRMAATADLDNDMRRNVSTLCTAAFGDPYDALFDFLPADGLHILAYAHDGNGNGRSEGQLIGHAVATPRMFRIGATGHMRAAYVDAVATLPGLQGCGVGGRVMDRLMREAAREYHVAGLSTFIPTWYTRLGWQAWQGDLALVRDEHVTASVAVGQVMVYAFDHTPALDVRDRLVASWRPGGGW